MSNGSKLCRHTLTIHIAIHCIDVLFNVISSVLFLPVVVVQQRHWSDWFNWILVGMKWRHTKLPKTPSFSNAKITKTKINVFLLQLQCACTQFSTKPIPIENGQASNFFWPLHKIAPNASTNRPIAYDEYAIRVPENAKMFNTKINLSFSVKRWFSANRCDRCRLCLSYNSLSPVLANECWYLYRKHTQTSLRLGVEGWM